MSLFADRLPSVFDRQYLGFDVRSSPRLGLHSVSRKFPDSSKDSLPFSPFSMRVPNHGAPSLSRGFYDDFDSVFHDRRFEGDFSSRRQATESRNGGKEYVIPITIEKGSSPTTNSSTANSPSRRLVDIHGDSTKSKCSRRESPSFGSSQNRETAVEIPIVREPSDSHRKNSLDSKREIKTQQSPSRTKSGLKDIPPTFTLLTPTTHNKGSSATEVDGDDDDIIYLDEEDFFPNRQSPKSEDSVHKKDLLSFIDDDWKRDKAEVSTKDLKKESGTFSESLRRKPLRLSTREIETSATTVREAEIKSARAKPSVLTSDLNDAESSDCDVTYRRQAVPESSRCCQPGLKIITPPPSYPIYDYLQPRLASIGRKVDYIRGDGNCLFRAISKELYGTEDYHVDCRQEVCNLIEEYPNVFNQYIDGADVARHVEQMRVLGTWATTCEIYAVATLLQRQVYVLAPSPTMDSSQPSADYHWLLFSPRPVSRSSTSSASYSTADGSSNTKPNRCYVTLCHTNSNHYDRIAPISAQCNCQIPPPELNGVSILMDLTESEEDDMMQQQ